MAGNPSEDWGDLPSPPPAAAPAEQWGDLPEASASKPGKSGSIGHLGQNDAIMYGLANSVPFAHDIGAAVQAGETYLPKWAATDDIGETDPNATFKDRFSQQKQRISDVDSRLASQFPKTSVLTPIIAGTAALPVSGPVEGLSSVLGRGLPFLRGLPATAAASGLVGGVYGAAYGAGTGDNLNERLSNAGTNAGLGGAFGAAAPVAGRVVGGLWDTAASKFGRNPDKVAQAAIEAARDPKAAMSSSDIANATAANQPITTADVLGGSQIQRLADKAAVGSPQAQSTIKGVVDPRFDDQGQRSEAFMQHLFGSSLDPSDIIGHMKAQAQVANGANYKAAFNNPKAKSVWNPGLENLIQSPAVRSAISGTNRVAQEEAVLEREMARANGQPIPANPIIRNPFGTDANGMVKLTDQNVTPSLPFWDIVKRNLDSMHDSALDKFNKPTNDSRLIDGMRKALVANLDNAVPEYKAARSGAAGFFGESDAFTAGMKYLGKKNALQSSQSDAALKSLTPAQKALFAQGVAADMVQKAKNANTRTNALRQFNDPATAGKLQNALGPYAAQVESFLRVEDRMNQLRQSLGSSLTGQRNVDQQGAPAFGHGFVGAIGQTLGPVAGGAVVGGATANHEGGNPIYGALAGAGAGFAMQRGATHAQAVNEAIARALMENDPQKIAKTAGAIAQKPSLMNALRQLGPHHPLSQLAIPSFPQMSPTNPSNQPQLAPAYASGGAVKRKSHEELVSRLMGASEKAKASTKRDTKNLLAVPDNTVARALAIAQKSI